MRIQYSAEAAADLERIEDYYTERAGSEVAEHFVDRVTTTLERLIARNPKAGRLRTDFGAEIRSFPVLPYLVFYRIARGRVLVIRILHGQRDLRPPLTSLLIAI